MTLQVINSPFTEQQVKLLNELIPNLTEQQKAWLTGYLTAVSSVSVPVAVQEQQAAPVQTKDITILFASQTGTHPTCLFCINFATSLTVASGPTQATSLHIQSFTFIYFPPFKFKLYLVLVI